MQYELNKNKKKNILPHLSAQLPRENHRKDHGNYKGTPSREASPPQ
jgi:hypothetical protein